MKKELIIKLSSYSYFLMMFFLPISLLLDNIFLGLLFLSVLLNSKKTIKNNTLYYLFAFFTFTFLNGVLNSFFEVEKENYLRLLPLLIIPFSLGNIDNITKLKGLFFLSLGIVIIQLNSVYGIINYYYFTEGKKYALRNYYKVNEILNYERPYLGFFSAINIIICLYYFVTHKRKILSIVVALFSLILIIVISARLAIIVVALTGLITVFKIFKTKNIIKPLLILFGILFLVLLSKSSLKYRFLQITKDARLVTWTGASDIFFKNSYYIFGSGSEQQIRDNLLEYYKDYDGFESEAEHNRFITKNYNTHNQYINELLRGGFVGLFLLVIPQVILLYSNFKNNNDIALMFLSAIISFSFVENILDRQVGVYLYALLLCLTGINYKVKE